MPAFSKFVEMRSPRRLALQSFEKAATRRVGILLASVATLLGVLRHWGPRVLMRALCKFFGLRPPRPGSVSYLGGLAVPGGERGITLCTFAYVRQEPAPTLLVRTPYGKVVVHPLAYAVASQGFNVVVQDCRGRFKSSGDQSFGAFEDLDGVATLDWLGKQNFKWFDPERVTMFGISYLGIVQWALVAGLKRREDSPTQRDNTQSSSKLAAITPLFAASRVHDVFFKDNAFVLDFYLRYLHLMTRTTSALSRSLLFLELMRFEFRLRRHLPSCLGLRTLHQKLGVPYLFKHNPRRKARFWQNRDYSDAVEHAPPALIATGWHDLFLDGSLRDFKALVDAHGKDHARLLVGPWTHLDSVIDLSAFRVLLRSSLDFLGRQVRLASDLPEQPHVRLWVMGKHSHEGEWHDFEAWPPENAQDTFFVLGPGSIGARTTSDEHPCAGRKCRITYDPLKPTPSVGGSQFSPLHAGEVEQSSFCSRDDVLCFDSEPLDADSVVVGNARLRLHMRASQPHFDVFARLCDVHPSGQCFNVCDAVLRTRAAIERSQSFNHAENGVTSTGAGETITDVTLTFAATAKRFQAGHHIRLLVAGGAFPAFARQFGDVEQALVDEPLDVRPCELEVLFSERAPSALWLPCVSKPTETPQSVVSRLDSGESVESTDSRDSRRRSLHQASAEQPKLYKKQVSREFDKGLRKVHSDLQHLK